MFAGVLASVAVLAPSAHAAARWLPADKHGFVSAVDRSSPVWLTLRQASASEVYWPDLGTPAVRSLTFAVGGTPETRGAATTQLGDPRSLTARQTVTDRRGRWRLVKTWITDPARATVLVDVRYVSLDGRARPLSLRLDPALRNGARGDRGRRRGATLIAVDRRAASALRASPRLRRLRADVAGRGDVVQTARTALTGRRGHRRMTVALAFGRSPGAARRTATRSLRAGFARLGARYAGGWHRYLDSLKPAPRAAEPVRAVYDTSLMVLRASEDKRHPGASIASPSMPWAWGDGSIEQPSGAYHLVWSRDLYQVATAQLAAGDTRVRRARALLPVLTPAAPRRLVPAELDRRRDGALDEAADGRGGAAPRARLAARAHGRPDVPGARQAGRGLHRAQGPAHTAGALGEPERILPRLDRLRGRRPHLRRGHRAAQRRRRSRGTVGGDRRRMNEGIERWTLTTNGPLSRQPYYLRVTKDGRPDRATTYDIGDSGPSKADQRRVVDPSFLELVRLGLRRPDDPNIVNTVAVVDRELGVQTPAGQFWRRFSFDGYGEHRDGAPWGIGKPDTFKTLGRAWPLFAGERGEYELAAGRTRRRAWPRWPLPRTTAA